LEGSAGGGDAKMIVRFKTDCNITVYKSVDGAGYLVPFLAGQGGDFTVIEEQDESHVNVQFNDGSVAFGVSKDWYETSN
jgi:hypothetical protein